MNKLIKELELIANNILENSGKKPNYSDRHFINAIIVFQDAIMDKMFDVMGNDNMAQEYRMEMAESCGKSLRNLIKTYTGVDTFEIKNYL